MLEMDVCETRDGILVVHHDQSLSRTCGIDKEVGKCLFRELPPFREEVEMHFAEAGQKMKSSADGIPSLEAVLRRYPQLAMDI